MWDDNGFEGVIPVDNDLIDQYVFDIMSDNKLDPRIQRLNNDLRLLVLRAQVNAHRNCEIYAVEFKEKYTFDTIVGLCEFKPKIFKKLFKKHGTKIV
jgi:hypothetical protein